MSKSETESIIESILFFSGDGVSIQQLSDIIECDKSFIHEAILQLNERYLQTNSGICITRIDDCYQICTAPKNSSYIKKFLQKPAKKILTAPLIETLAIVAYSQPITKIQIEDIRGVRSDHTIGKLIEYNLICEIGRLDVVGKPILFGTTNEFLRHFGLKSIDEIPKVQDELIERFKMEVQDEIDYYE